VADPTSGHLDTSKGPTIGAITMTTTTGNGTEFRSSTGRSTTLNTADAQALVADAIQGDSAAWTEIVRRYGPILHATARRFRLSREEHEDAVQRIWQRAVENLHAVRDGAALPGWLATAMRRECLATLRARTRETPAGDMSDHYCNIGEPDPVDVITFTQKAAALHLAVAELPRRQRAVICALLETPAPSYAEISNRLDMPVGSIGPIRGRALQRLASTLAPLRPGDHAV
jgi:RNA polymerase sigma factor (sigma-70 family)